MARQLNFAQIEAFKALMQMGTTTSAALMLNTTQPSISRRIAELQAATELKLFDLHQGRLRPTSEGKLLYKTIQKHFSGLEKIESVVAVMRTSGTGVLRLGCTPTLGTGLLPAVIRQFLKKFPDTYINLQTMSTTQLADQLHQDLIDLALTTSALNPADFAPVVIAKEKAVCVLPLEHRLKDARSITVKALKDEQMLSISESDELTIQIKSLLRSHQIPEHFAIETTSSITVCALVAAGNGVGIVNPYVARTFAGQLLVKKFEPAILIPVQMATPAHTAPSLLTRHFVEVMLAYVKAG